MFNVGQKVILDILGTEYDGMEAMIVEQKQDMFLKIQILDNKKFGKDLMVLKYQIKD